MDAGQVAADGGVPRDSGQNPPNDAGFADSGAETPDGGEAPRDGGEPPRDAGNPGCTYPAGAREPMALDEIMTAYSWPAAIDGTGGRFDLDLTQAHCNTDPDMDWSPFDVLLFVSIPAW